MLSADLLLSDRSNRDSTLADSYSELGVKGSPSGRKLRDGNPCWDSRSRIIHTAGFQRASHLDLHDISIFALKRILDRLSVYLFFQSSMFESRRTEHRTDGALMQFI